MAERRRRVSYKKWLKNPNIAIPRTTINSRNTRKKLCLINNNVVDERNAEELSDITMVESPLLEFDTNSGLSAGEDYMVTEYSSAEMNNNSESSSTSNDCIEPCINSIRESKQMFAEGSPISLIEAEILIMAFAVRHKLTDCAIGDLLELFNVLLPYSTLARTRYTLLKKFDSKKDVKSLKKFYCSECNNVIPVDENGSVICAKCNSNCSSDFFYYFPIEDALTEFVNSPDYLIMVNRNKYSDVNDSAYVKNNKDIANTDITLQFNTDGVSPSNSSSQSLWPLQVMINNLPLALKRKYLLLCGLWFSTKKPPMNLYLQFFVNEMCKLHKEGILRKNDHIVVKVHVVVCVCDSVARPALQNISQFNGRYGCTYCLQEGTNNNYNTRIYPEMCVQPLRNLEQHLSDAKEAINSGKPVNGVKGPSVLLLLPNFDITQCCSPDYMHSILLGVVRLFLDEWFDSSNHLQQWYLGGKLMIKFDDKLLSIKPPSEISRPPRSILYRKKWKANELRNFVLYYSYHCLNGLLPKSYLRHWSALVYSLGIFLSPSISDDEWKRGTEAMFYFVLQIEKLYETRFYKFNIHLLLHVPNWVHQFGALWASSCFPYEHLNGVLNKLFINGTGVQQQICKRYFRFKKLMRIAENLFSNECDIGPLQNSKALFTHLLLDDDDEYSGCNEDDTHFSKFSSRITHQNLADSSTKQKIEAVFDSMFEVADSAIAYQFFRMKGMLIHSYEYCELKKRNNSVVKLKDGTIVMITKILKVKLFDKDVEKTQKIVIEALPLRTYPRSVDLRDVSLNKFIRPVITQLKNDPNLQRRIVLPEMIDKKCIYINDGNQDACFAISLINHLENGW